MSRSFVKLRRNRTTTEPSRPSEAQAESSFLSCAPRPGVAQAPLQHRRSGELNVAGQPHHGENLNRPPGKVDLEPTHPMARRKRECMVIVVPALAPSDERNKPIVHRVVAAGSSIAAVAAQVCGAVHEPRRMVRYH